MDVVYFVRSGDANEELRYSLRSLANLPHDRVWIAGHKPRWVTNTSHIPVPQTGPKHENTWANWRAIANCPELSEEVIVFNDDFFIVRPLPKVPACHAGPLDEWIARLQPNSPTARRMRHTRDVLDSIGRTNLLSWELHMPIVIDRRWLAEAIEFADMHRARHPSEPLCKRTFYGGYAGLTGGVLTPDCKIRDPQALPDPDWHTVSTSDAIFRSGRSGRWLKSMFTEPGAYEAIPPARPRQVTSLTTY
jgi:hypothetical protein